MAALQQLAPASAPDLVVAAASAADVRSAILTAREHDLPLAVWATGHGTPVRPEGAVVLETAGMASVLVDPDRRIARVGPGARWGSVIAAAAPFGLAPLAGSSPDVGVTGYTLGGGVGWLARRYGFAADSVVRADLVTADGRLVTATPDSRPDLFWALRGGGGNFGVVTSLEFRLHPVERVYAGVSYFAVERAAETLARYRDWIATAPDELSTAVVLTPDALALKVMYVGEADAAERLLRPLRDAVGPALGGGFRATTFAGTAMGGTPPRQVEFVQALPDAAIDALVQADATVEVRHWGGAMARPGADAGPVGGRTAPLSVIADAPVPGLREHATGGSFLNFLADRGRTATAYTAADHRRLREVKRAYDPSNLFRTGHRIAPA
jgi:FAD/FMN-containing dehydrogenase